MGCNCNCLRKENENKNEMVNGMIPGLGIGEEKNNQKDNEIKNLVTENDNEENLKPLNMQMNNINLNTINEDNQDTNPYRNAENQNQLKTVPEFPANGLKKKISNDSSFMSKIQEINESIFDYFDEIRTNPQNFERIAEEHEVGDVLSRAIKSKITCNNLIMNSFFNLLLSSYLQDYTVEGDDCEKLLESIEKEEKLKIFNKKLYVCMGELNNPNEVIWALLKNNKEKAYELFFSNNIESLVISCQIINNNKNFRCYFLFLSKKV